MLRNKRRPVWLASAAIGLLGLAYQLAAPAQERRSALGSEIGEWTLIGPLPLNTGGSPDLTYTTQPGWRMLSGWMSALAVDMRDASVVYVGAANGGVWKTTDGGKRWIPLTDAQPSLAVGSIALDPSDQDTVYVGTGNLMTCCVDPRRSAYGVGILKSRDGGSTWTHLPGPFVGPAASDSFSGGASIISLAVHPTDGQILLAGVSFPNARFGIFRSTDGGLSWTHALRGNFRNKVLFDPSAGAIAYAAVSSCCVAGAMPNGMYRSADAGLTWSPIRGSGENALPTSNVGNIEIAIAPSNPLVLYVGIANSTNGSLLGLYKTADGGASWNRLSNTPDYCTSACGDRHAIRVHPTNPNVVFVGGRLNPNLLFRTFDGGNTWAEVSASSDGMLMHADLKGLAFSRDGAVLYLATDGGAYNTTDPLAPSIRWMNLNSTLAITHFLPGQSLHPTNINAGFAGPNEGGTVAYGGIPAWNKAFSVCGDGGPTAIDPQVPTNIYADCIDGSVINIQRSTASGRIGSWTSAQTGIDASDRKLASRPLVIDPSRPQRLYFGTFRVYQTVDSASSWAAISGDLTRGSGYVTTIAVAPTDSNIVYVGSSDGKVSITATAGDGPRAVWVDRTIDLPTRFITKIAVGFNNHQLAYAVFSGFAGAAGDPRTGHVFKTVDGGMRWSDVSGNLPNIPVNDIVLDPDAPLTLYAATDSGVFASADDGTTWAKLGRGLPNVVVSGLNLHRATRTLRAGTYGRSMWDLKVPAQSGGSTH